MRYGIKRVLRIFSLKTLMNMKYKLKYSVLYYKHLEMMQGSENIKLL